jgi:AmmeMemoRadiSam system protein A
MTEPPPALPDLSDADRAALLALARAVIEGRLGVPRVVEPEPRPAFDQPRGAFVTVYVAHELRGCVGLPEAGQTLGRAIEYCARAAAFGDPRFPPITPADLPGLTLEISVLTPLEPCADPALVEVGRHGLAVELGGVRGLLLPQVASERGWTREQFLDHTCLKAGLPRDAWRRGARLQSFEAVVFGEEASRSRPTA